MSFRTNVSVLFLTFVAFCGFAASYKNVPTLHDVSYESKLPRRALLDSGLVAQLRFWVALNKGDNEELRTALEDGADPNDETEPSKYRPLHLAAAIGNLEAVKILLEFHAEVDAKTVNGTAPLHYAANRGLLEITKVLIGAKADVDISDNRHFTALHYAAYALQDVEYDSDPFNSGGYFEIAKEKKVVYSQKVGVNEGKLPGFHQYFSVAKTLIDALADVDAATKSKETPLYYTPAFDQYTIAKLLIENRATVNWQDAENETPLHEAVAYGAVGVTQVLLLNGADLSLKENNGLTAAEFICRCKEYKNDPGLTQCAPGKCVGQYDSLVLKKFFSLAKNLN